MVAGTKYLIPLVASLIFAQSSYGVTCAKVFHSAASDRKVDIWKLDQVEVQLPSGRNDLVRFSLDSETSVANALRLIRSTEEGEKALGKTLKGLKIKTAEAIRVSGMTEAQFLRFGIRKSAQTGETKSELSLMDLTAEILEKVIDHSPQFKAQSLQIYNEVLDILSIVFEKKSWPLHAEDDGGFPEIRHNSSESSPREFRQLVEAYHKAIKGANTHFHVSLPSEVSAKSLVSIVRAIETRITLRFLADNNPGRIAHLYESALVENASRVTKSIVAFQPYRWHDPAPAHDIEIRHYMNLNSAMDDIALTALLGKSHDQLKDFKINFGPWMRLDPQFGNATNALAYAGVALKQSPRVEDHSLGEALSAFSAQFRQARGEPGPEVREQVSQFLTQHSIADRLDFSVFLK